MELVVQELTRSAGFPPPALNVDTLIKSTLMYFYLLNFFPMVIYLFVLKSRCHATFCYTMTDLCRHYEMATMESLITVFPIQSYHHIIDCINCVVCYTSRGLKICIVSYILTGHS